MSYEPFVANLIHILEKHGYPDKRVALPLERMYEVAYEKQLNFNRALELLRDRGIDHEKTTEKIVFFPLAPAAQGEAPATPDMAGMMAQAMKMMQEMSPEQLAELQSMVMSMSDDEKAEIMRKAREMGLG